jgi:hypothetical protein
VTLIKSWSKKISKEMFGIGPDCSLAGDCSQVLIVAASI